MRIGVLCSDEQILIELGERLKAERIRSGFTQEELSVQSGVSKRTIERFENGESVQFVNLIKIFRVLRRLDLLDTILPSFEKTPFEYIDLPQTEKKQRVRNLSVADNTSGFKWGDEK